MWLAAALGIVASVCVVAASSAFVVVLALFQRLLPYCLCVRIVLGFYFLSSSVFLLIPINERSNTSFSLNKSPFLHHVYWSKYYFIPSAFLRAGRNTSTMLRLP